MKIQIEDNLYIRPATLEDATSLFYLVDKNRSYLRQWLNWLDYTKTENDSAEYIKTVIQNIEDKKKFETLIFLDEQLVGCIGFNKTDFVNRLGEIGYWLSEDMQGRGVISKCFRALVNFGFNELNLNRIQIRIDSLNKKSKGIATRFNMKYEGTIRQESWLYDHFQDMEYYSILKSEWQN